jgi:hypothetical protein
VRSTAFQKKKTAWTSLHNLDGALFAPLNNDFDAGPCTGSGATEQSGIVDALGHGNRPLALLDPAGYQTVCYRLGGSGPAAVCSRPHDHQLQPHGHHTLSGITARRDICRRMSSTTSQGKSCTEHPSSCPASGVYMIASIIATVALRTSLGKWA